MLSRLTTKVKRHKSKVFSEDLLRAVDNSLKCAGLPSAVTASAAGGEFNRHAMGRQITTSKHWRGQKRLKRERAFSGWEASKVALPALQAQLVERFDSSDSNGSSPAANAPKEPLANEQLTR